MDAILFGELAINGALTGLLYSLFAIGLVLIYKSSSVPNLAQGALTMLGAYVVLAFSHEVGLPLWLSVISRVVPPRCVLNGAPAYSSGTRTAATR